MPSPENAASEAEALIRRYYDTFNRGDREAMLALLAGDVVHDINHGETETGRDAFRRFLERMDGAYAEKVDDLVVMATPDGARAAAEFFIDGKYLKTDTGLPEATGQAYRLRVGAFFELSGGLIRRVTNYYNLADWLRQIGA
ncbi:MAG: nuclear transport factor 2 family protein [Verrucomicrobiae bacterium]|nr:nuclear transport factor 2 family protein [Verrucomicrobiae bacterium]MCP5539180.1 nuclear transport factor 2 family protein [Akkermansiaceae bacterium]MCP5549831.1 nuclear transport factor 2 family protein [Akkermansiaceae bacterium]